jgi:hypothetical protein
MEEARREFHLSKIEWACVTQVASGDELLSNLFKEKPTMSGAKAIVRLDRKTSERLRDLLSEHLAKVGFDRDYVPNDQGRLLEGLIDKFYVP